MDTEKVVLATADRVEKLQSRTDREFQSPPMPNLIFVLGGVVLPVVCFLLSHLFHAMGILYLAECYESELGEYLPFMLANEAVKFFIPFLGFAMISLLWAMKDTYRVANSTWVRVGLLSGVVLSLQYTIALWSLGIPSILFVLFVGIWSALRLRCGPVIPLIIVAIFLVEAGIGIRAGLLPSELSIGLSERGIPSIVVILSVVIWTPLLRRFGPLAALLIVVNLLGFGIWLFLQDFESYVKGLIFAPVTLFMAFPLLLMAAPGISLVIYLRMFLRLRSLARRRATSPCLVRSPAFLVWAVGYICALWEGIRAVLSLHQQGAYMTGGCYVCTAAARGHRWIVKSRLCRTPEGVLVLVNDQMRYLKCGELILCALVPRLHRWCRLVYDLLGPVLARRIRHPIVADTAYLSLKPIEWMTRIVLHFLLPNASHWVQRVYPSQEDED